MQKKTGIRWKWALLPLFVLCTVWVLGILSTYVQTEKTPLYLTPTLQDANGWEIYTLTDGARTSLPPQALLEVEVGETFYLSRVLTEELAAGEYTFLLLDSQRPVSVFLDGEPLYTTCSDAVQAIGQVRFPVDYAGLPQRGEQIRCSLPVGYAGKTLTIATANILSKYVFGMPAIQLSSQGTEAEVWMTTANHNAMPATAFAVTAILLLGLLLFSLFGGGRDLSLLLLTGAALAQFFYYLREYAFSSPASTALDTSWAMFLPCLMLLLPELFLAMQIKSKRRRWLCAGVLLCAAAVSIIPNVCNLFGAEVSSMPFILSSYVGLLALFCCAALEARNKNRVLQLFLGGLGIICVCVVALALCSAANEGVYFRYLTSMFGHALDLPQLLYYWCGTTLFALSCAIGVYVLVRNTADTQTALAVHAQRLEQLDHDMAVQKQFYADKLSSEEELHALRHDMQGHLSTLSALLADGKATEATRYLNKLEQQHQKRSAEVFCDDPYMNAVLGIFAARFRENGVAFICRCGVEGWTLPGMEICLILNNALENALEASLRLPEAERLVKVQAAVRKKQLLFRISNRFDGELNQCDGLPVSRKSEKGHGYGLQNIQSTAQRLGGEMLYRTEDDCFVLDVRLPLPKGAEKGGPNHAV